MTRALLLGIGLIAVVFAAAAAARLPADAAEHASFGGSFTVRLEAPADRALRLFDPVGEAAWAHGWAPVFAREADRETLPEGTVFTTRGPEGGVSTWVLQRYDRAAHEIAYTVYHPNGVVVAIRVGVRDEPNGHSTALVRYDLVATTDEGDRFVRDYAVTFPHMQPYWQQALDAVALH
jgi:hypothetical protein